MEVKDTRPASIDEVMEVLGKIKDHELSYEQQLALQHAKKFGTSGSKSEKVRKQLAAKNILSDRSIIKIIEIMPKNQMTLRQILAQEKKTFSEEDVAAMMAIIKEK